jgi:flavoprotein
VSTFNDMFDRVNKETKIEGPHGWIQWKGTEVCIDLHCSCGHHGHVDADFFYAYRCAGCGKCYHVGSYVKLVEATPEEVAADGWHPFITGEEP